ncbi:hypothetical protein MPH_13472 [Macrophomina phaseolina MS6]|uniref:Uncharacterized protein n=1 Tax=Macrophomina phaseolina (strain MS6) TaxID=1126212 RepID=K2R5P8_MACPH|nr:hypothetical protein MPH_13472 [Macrophomina phaseolina MS6]
MEERTYERDVTRTFKSRTLIPRLVSRGLQWQGSIPGKRTRFLQFSFVMLLLVTGTFIHSTATAFFNWTSPDPFDVAFSSFRQSKDSHASNGQGYSESTGCVSVDADIWLRNEELYVGHTAFDLTNDRTLRNAYINPLKDILETVNSGGYLANDALGFRGVFYVDPAQTFTLLIDFKSEGPETLR